MLNDLIIGMAGSGGDGIVSAGESLMSAAAEEGYYAILTKSFGSQIRGGESSCRLRVATTALLNPGGALSVAIALNWEDFLRFGGELPVTSDTVIAYEQGTDVAPDAIPLKVRPAIVRAVPFEKLAKSAAGTLQAKNNVVLGLLAGWFGLGREAIIHGIRKKFDRKGHEVVAGNERAFAEGFAYAEQNPIGDERRLAPAASGRNRRVTDGNEVCAEAALFAGCRFFGGYPITPASEIMQHLDREIWKHGGSLLQAEDEIAGIAAVVGASFAGVKAMTATSGPGLSLKSEVLGLASQAELPLVCVNVQRGGPSTGLPTKSEQADLFASAFSAHGDSVRPILAPISVTDMFGVMVEAFNIAEEFQTPVIVLSDQEIAQRKDIIDPVDTSGFKLVERLRPTEQELAEGGYTRFRFTKSGVSPITHPGMKGGAYLAAGIEHNERGDPTSNGEMHERMNDKRLNKMSPLKSRRDLFMLEGDADAPLGVISWGSVAGAALEAVRMARARGIAVKLLIPKLLYPVAEEVYRDFFASLQHCIVVEQSHQGQLHRLIRMWVDVPAEFVSFAKSGANPIAPALLVEKLTALAAMPRHPTQSPLHHVPLQR